jgi:hypothetical protein
MPKMKNGELILPAKQQKFYDHLLNDPKLNATQAAIRAGYNPSSAHTIGSRLKNAMFKGGTAPDAWKKVLQAAGWDYFKIASLFNKVEEDGGPKDWLNLIKIALASYGVPTSDGVARQTVNVQGSGPMMVFTGEEDRMAALMLGQGASEEEVKALAERDRAKNKELFERVVGKPYQGQRTMLTDDNPPVKSATSDKEEAVRG